MIDRALQPAEASIIPSELTGPLPRRTRLAKNGITWTIRLTTFLVFAAALTIPAGMNARQLTQARIELRRYGSEVIGKVAKLGRARVFYSFNINGRSFTGNASLQGRVLLDSDPLAIRYLPSNPVVNHPAAWEESTLLALLPFLSPIMFLMISLAIGVSMLIDRRLVAEAIPAVAVVTKCTARFWGGTTIKYEFRTEDGSVIKANSSSQKLQEIGASICVLYQPTNPNQNYPYERLAYRAAQ